jgi:hypothetical protein
MNAAGSPAILPNHGMVSDFSISCAVLGVSSLEIAVLRELLIGTRH